MENSGIIKGKGPDGVSFSSCSPQYELEDAQKHHKPMAMEKKQMKQQHFFYLDLLLPLLPLAPLPSSFLKACGSWS